MINVKAFNFTADALCFGRGDGRILEKRAIDFLQCLTPAQKMNLENDFAQLRKLLEARNEWLLIDSSGRSFALGSSEIEIEIRQNKILLGFLADAGFQTRRVASFEQKTDEILLTLARNFGKETEKIRFVPRVSAKQFSDSIELARFEKANEIARLVVAETRGAKLLKVALNVENGRLAQIIIEHKNGNQIAVLSDVSAAASPENLIVAAIFRLARLRKRKKNPVEILWIIAEKKRAKNMQNLHALLRNDWRGRIEIFEILREDAKIQTGENAPLNHSLKKLEILNLDDLWRGKPKKNQSPANDSTSRAALEIVRLAPENIDVVSVGQGETLRFSGLPFARVRRVGGKEKVWFGVGKKRQILGEKNLPEFAALVEELKIHRRFDAANKRHEFYRLAPEAWLESVLRRDIKLLDANLILSPVYNQFRAGRDKIDLLAARLDGRLVVVELKTFPDREMIFQAADYWRKIEFLRRKGNLQSTKIFGDLKISDEPPLVFLAAPFLSFHRDFDFLAQTVAKEIEIYRFDLNENWRESLKVVRRKRI